MKEIKDNEISDGKLVELTYKVIDLKTEAVLTSVEFPIGYIHGVTEALAPQVTAELKGKRLVKRLTYLSIAIRFMALAMNL